MNEAIIKANMPAPSPDNMVFVCGPPGMVAAICGPKTEKNQQGEVDGHMKKIGYTSDMVFKF